ncbi:hypothetical protein JCGZ_01589 [Jatropha curcas]|uniref:Uncharacterized protein n=1 Tax=Jatropha curcas TaxID=180498 RepID=A0A067LCQ6_JATCU|nr:hypothetical protein JCGZ_01589 [Jatropha curcas]
MSGASSSAQPPMPPSLPSVPSSSTPLSGPVESSPASQSPTAPASSKPRNKLSLVAGQHNETSGDGSGPSRHKGGSISAIETSRLLAKKYGREPTLKEVFTYTHTKGHDGNTFVDKRAVDANPDDSAEEISALRAHVDEQERQLVELRAHVMRMSGQHGAGTSSSYPPPAIVS